MFSLRRFRPRLCVRGNATLQPSAPVEPIPLDPLASLRPSKDIKLDPSKLSPEHPSTSETPLPTPSPPDDSLSQPPTPPRRGGRTRRPPISLENPRTWKRPLAFGVLPAYDEALKVIQEDSVRLKEEAGELQRRIEEVEKAGVGVGVWKEGEELEKMRERLRILHIQSEINLPRVRWKVANGMADMSKIVDRYLLEQRWRNEGALDLLMERLYQMHVVPDVLPALHPSLDLRITFPGKTTRSVRPHSGAPYTTITTLSKPNGVEPGMFLIPEQTMKPPRLFTDVFHTDERLYMLLMVDPDSPDEANHGFRTFLHWLQPNIPLSAQSRSIPTSTIASAHVPYIPPHPQRGTPYHRYVLLLLPQPAGGPLTLAPLSMDERSAFNVREFVAKYGINAKRGGGAHMWREVWSEGVSRIYKDVLKMDEPRFGRPPKRDRFAELKQRRRYE